MKGVVFIVDDDAAMRKALARLVRAAGLDARTYDSAVSFLMEDDPDTPGCVVLDVAMPRVSGLELQQVLAERGGERSIVFLTGRGDISMSVRAMKAGAVDFLTKPVDEVDLLKAINAALERDRLAREERDLAAVVRQRLATLTPREQEVLRHVAFGRQNKQIAADLGTSVKTIKVHRHRVMSKMAVRSLAELVRVAERLGIDHEAVSDSASSGAVVDAPSPTTSALQDPREADA